MFRGTYIQRWARVPVGFRVPRSEKTKEERDLGVVTMASAKPAAHCAKAARTAQAVFGQIARAFYFRAEGIFLGLYSQFTGSLSGHTWSFQFKLGHHGPKTSSEDDLWA